MRIQDVIKKAVITEKALSKEAKQGYVFEVAVEAHKTQIKEAIEKLFNVEVGTIKTLIRKGKVKRKGRRMRPLEMPDAKKAYVVLKKGSIDIIPKS